MVKQILKEQFQKIGIAWKKLINTIDYYKDQIELRIVMQNFIERQKFMKEKNKIKREKRYNLRDKQELQQGLQEILDKQELQNEIDKYDSELVENISDELDLLEVKQECLDKQKLIKEQKEERENRKEITNELNHFVQSYQMKVPSKRKPLKRIVNI